MPTLTPTADVDLIEDLVIELGDLAHEARPDYSGRGMYGDHCLGIVTADAGRLMVEVGRWLGAREANDDIDHDTAWRLTQPRTDSMGWDTIVYWPALAIDEADWPHVEQII